MTYLRMRRIFATTAALGALAVAAPAHAACADLMQLDLQDGAVTSAQIVREGAFAPPAGSGPPPGVGASPFSDVPAFCRVQMTLTPSADSDIRSEVWLPLEGWNGKYVGVGNGVWAGSISFAEMGRNLARDYATAATDTGHVGNGLTAEWAAGHPEKMTDFGHRAVHVTTVAAKQAVEAFYGRAPELSLWNSCSTGGRQGLMAAHRYPADFDVISAMAPANPMTDLMTQSLWLGSQAQRFGAQLSANQLGLVHAAVLEQCDALDGLADGVIGRPLQCRPDLARLQCTAGSSDTCLDAGQLQAVHNFYGGVRAQDGSVLLPGWPYGAEMQMAALTLAPEPFPVASSYFRDLVYGGNPGWDWRGADYATVARDARRFGAEALNVPPEGLAGFFARGGKLMLSHGWNDGLIPATNTVAFHYALYSSLPRDQAERQLRLFMAPGMEHCSGGEGPSQFDTLGVIDDWASTGMAPTRILATRPTQAPSFPGQPALPAREPMERPLCAWPLVAQYDGQGAPSLATSFSCAVPEG